MSLHSSALSLFRVNKSMFFLFKFSRGAIFTSLIEQFLVWPDRDKTSISHIQHANPTSYPLCLEFHYSSYFTLYDLYHRLIKTTLKSQSPIRCGFAPGFVNDRKRCTRLAAASDKVYKLLVHGWWFFPGTPASSTTTTLVVVCTDCTRSCKSNYHMMTTMTVSRNFCVILSTKIFHCRQLKNMLESFHYRH
jgi:hypothetical protein